MKGFVYILQDEEGRFYIGSTNNLERRLKQHLYGHTQTTRRMQQPKIMLSQQYPTVQEARIVERRLKKLKRKDYIAQIISDGYIKIKLSSFNG